MSDNIQTGIQNRIDGMHQRVQGLRDADMYFYNMPVSELKGSSEVVVSGRTMLMLASYGYLGLLGHPRINKAAGDAIKKYGSGTHGVRVLAGTLDMRKQLQTLKIRKMPLRFLVAMSLIWLQYLLLWVDGI